MSDTIPKDMTPDQLALAVQNKVALDAKKGLDTVNHELKACYGNCQISPDDNIDKTKNSAYLMDTHNQMVNDFDTIKKDTTLTDDHKLLLQNDLITQSEIKFKEKVSEVQGSIETDIARQEKQLFTKNPKLDDISAAMMPAMIPMLLENHYEFIDNPAMADAINILNLRGIFKDPVTQKQGKPRKDITNTLNRKWSNEAYTRLEELSADKKLIDQIAKKEKNIISKMRPPASKVNKIRNSQYKG